MKLLELTNEELCALAKNGDVTAQENLIKNNIGFITEIANDIFSEYGLKTGSLRISLDDLIQEGRIGLNELRQFSDLCKTGYQKCDVGFYSEMSNGGSVY